MKVIVAQLGSTTSSNNKHYAIALLETGQVIAHYGARTYPTGAGYQSKLVEGRGHTSTHAHNTLLQGADFFRKTFKAKFGKPEYNRFLIDFEIFDIAKTEQQIVANPYLVFTEMYGKKNTREDACPTYLSATLITNVDKFVTDIRNGKTSAPAPQTAPAPKMSARAAPAPKVQTFFTKVEPKIVRPNGELYHARELMGHTDVALLREFRTNNIYVRLAGAPGAGKTALAEAAFNDVITVSGHGDMTVAHFVGTYLPDQTGGWVWSDGPLVRAMREGRPLFVDEGTRIPTEVLNILFSVMDGRNVLRIDDRPDLPVVTGLKGFYVIMGYNPDTLGARALDEALVSRFRIQIDVKTDFQTAKKLGVPELPIKIARNLETRDRKDRENEGSGVWVPQMRELITYRDLIKMGAGEDFALATLLSSCPRVLDIPFVKEAIKDAAKKTIEIPTLGRIV